MTALFLYGPLASARVRSLIVGSAEAEVATLEGYAIQYPKSAAFPLAVAQEGALLEGVLLRGLSADAAARLHFVIEASGAVCGPCEPQAGAERLAAQTALASGDRDLASAQLSDAEWTALTLAAVAEILSYFGQRSAAEVASLRVMILARASAQVAAARGTTAQFRSSTPHDAVVVSQVETPHQGFFLTRTYQLRHPQFDGGMSADLTREVFVATDASIVLPYDPKRDRVLLVEQFRMGPFGRGDARPWMLEPVAGRIDAGETPESTAHRECEEEAGLSLYHLEKVSAHYCSPGDSTEYFHIFIGLCDLPGTAQGQGGLATEHEDIRTHVLSYEQAMGLLDSGEANAGPMVLALLWLAKSRDRLRATA